MSAPGALPDDISSHGRALAALVFLQTVEPNDATGREIAARAPTAAIAAFQSKDGTTACIGFGASWFAPLPQRPGAAWLDPGRGRGATRTVPRGQVVRGDILDRGTQWRWQTHPPVQRRGTRRTVPRVRVADRVVVHTVMGRPVSGRRNSRRARWTSRAADARRRDGRARWVRGVVDYLGTQSGSTATRRVLGPPREGAPQCANIYRACQREIARP